MHLRRKGGRYHWRRRVPLELVARWGRDEIVKALNTADRDAAEDAARRLSVASDQLFKRISVSLMLTPGQISTLAQQYLQDALEVDEEFQALAKPVRVGASLRLLRTAESTASHPLSPSLSRCFLTLECGSSAGAWSHSVATAKSAPMASGASKRTPADTMREAEQRLVVSAKERGWGDLKRFTQDQLGRSSVSIERVGTDRYKRTLARVLINGEDLATIIIKAGHGRPYDGKRRAGWCG